MEKNTEKMLQFLTHINKSIIFSIIILFMFIWYIFCHKCQEKKTGNGVENNGSGMFR